MTNRYANLTGSNNISDEFDLINQGFANVEQDVNEIQGEVQNNIEPHLSNTDIHVTPTDRQFFEDVQDHLSDDARHFTTAKTNKLNGIAAGAEVNQNAFSQVNNVPATAKEDTITFEGGTGIQVTTNPSTKKVTITATGESTPGNHASSHLTGGTDPIPVATDAEDGLMSSEHVEKLDGIEEGANNYVHPTGDGNLHVPATSTINDGKFLKAGNAAGNVSWQAIQATDVNESTTKRFVSDIEKSRFNNKGNFILTSGTSTAYTATIETAATNYYRGMPVYIELHTDAGASPTINVNGFGAKSVNGISKAGFYTLVYDGSAFISASGKGGGNNNELNVFAQSVLPDEGFEGIVVAEDFTVSNIVTDSDWYTGGTFSANTTDHVLSHALFKSAAIGNKLYYILSSGTDIYVYDKDTKITSVFVTVSGSGTNQSLISKGTDLYLARLQSTTLHLYKINSLSAIATTLATGTINQTYAQLVDYQDYIYLFTRNFSDSAFGLYKYSIISNTWTNLGLSITAGRQLFVVRKANIAFIFTSDLSNMRMHTYNLDTAVLTTCTLSGFAFANVTLSGAITGDKIYLQPYSTKNLYSIDVSMVGTNYAAVLITNPTTLANSGYVSVSLIDNELWLLNKADSTYLITRYIMDIKIFDANTVIIKRSDQRNGSYSTQLFSNNITGTNNRLLIDFDDVAYYDGTTLLTNIDAYYGNVTDWVKFK